MDAKRYTRHVALREVGAAGQQRLERSSMMIVGVGGLGCPAAQYLTSSGVGRLVLNDFDRVDLSNLPRQVLFDEGDIDSLKVDAAAKALRRLNPDITIDCLADRLGDAALAEAAAGVDVVLDCTDNFSTRLGINRACVGAGRPLVSGAALRFEGQLTVFRNRPGDPCYRCLYSEDDELLGDCAGNGVFAPVPGVVGTLMAAEAMKLVILGDTSLAGVLKLWDAITGDWQSIALRQDPDCPVCGSR
ncbi:MAG TPA: HesA/MoeB/ThiF family protein [Gammaproteobacteria bacterium]|nr:HesA/MoeB/ThiF family protein [Gammaproteobacteria bacterium]